MSCSHLDDYLSNNQNKLAVKNLIASVVFPISEEGIKLKVSLLCRRCTDGRLSDVMVCGSCIFSGCLRNGHMMQHFREMNHSICVSLELGEIFCLACGDYRYQEITETELTTYRRRYLSKLGMLDLAWRPAITDIPLLRWVRSPRALDPARPTRGLVNMGNTCFLNVVVQALAHTPALRDFLLSDEHRCATARASRDCLACELIRVAQQLYRSPDTTPCSSLSSLTSASCLSDQDATSSLLLPAGGQSGAGSTAVNGSHTGALQQGPAPPLALTNLLYMIWSHVADLARYDQHDAHELFLAILSLLHTHLSNSESGGGAHKLGSGPSVVNAGASGSAIHSFPSGPGCGGDQGQHNIASSRSSSTGLEDDDCGCIVHQAFMATLESKIIYDCGLHVSRHLEVFRDLSLEIFRLDESGVSLESSFRSYFGTERMRDAQCSSCRRLGATKQYSLFQLPNIFSVHLKRCHAKSKVNTKVHFPQELDLAPFISNTTSDKSLWEDKYSLYSVINHRGQNSAGHYTAYVRTEDNSWCLCDDQTIQLVSLAEVLRSDAYMLFYHKNSLAMKAT